ncbi:polysaccharide biosynthesis/export family protein [bacterium]|nr:polysaccharide biosynthesis/export family protein [bacterium]
MNMKFKTCNSLVIKRVMLIIGVLLFINASALFAQAERSSQWRNSARSLTIFQPGDAVRIQIWELFQGQKQNRDISGDYTIKPDGNIIMPLIGQVRIKGLTVYELEQILIDKYSSQLNHPYVSIRPLIRLTLQGAFNRPGAYRVDPSSSLWDVVALAGGPTSNCNLEGLRAERGGKVVIKKLLESFEAGISLEEVGIESGDQIIAPRKNELSIAFLVGIINLAASVLLLYLRLKSRNY